ncbi:MAG: TetR/AcrR family transcriptional regulator [Myxococcota bacterium]
MAANAKKAHTDGRRKKRPGLDEQRRILVDAAVGLFVEHGTRAVSVSQICQAADVSRDTYYRCFVDKDALIDEIWERAANAHIETFIFDAMPEGGPLDDWLAQAIDRLFDAVFEQHELAHFMFVEYGNPGSLAHTAVDAMFDAYARKVQAFFREHYDVRPSPLFLKSIMAAVQWTLLDTIRGGLSPASIARAKDSAVQLTTAAFGSLIDTDADR